MQRRPPPPRQDSLAPPPPVPPSPSPAALLNVFMGANETPNGYSPDDPNDDPNSPSANRLNQRTLGLTNRIWIILTLVGFVVFFTRLIFPPAPSPALGSHHAYNNAHLQPVKYLQRAKKSSGGNDTVEEDDEMASPFAFCPEFGPGDSLAQDYGSHTLLKTRVHQGSGARVQKVLHKAMSGLPVTISVLGGSVSSCHGAGDDPVSPKCWPSRFFEWWNLIFPHPASELTNGAMRRTTSAYFSFCNAHHLPDQTDLVVLEFDSEDPFDHEWINHFELLVRSILTRPDQPAVIVLGHFAPQVQLGHGFAGPEHLHTIVAQYYDLPHISIKPAIYPAYMADPDHIRKELYVDPVLSSPSGHQLIADVLISYIQSQTCEVWDAATGRSVTGISKLLTSLEHAKPPSRGLFNGMKQHNDAPAEADAKAAKDAANNQLPPAADNREGKPRGSEQDGEDEDDFAALLRVPQNLIRARPDDTRVIPEVQPFCVSANDLVNPLPPSLFSGSGWHAFHPPVSGGVHLYSAAHYFYSTTPRSKLRVPLVLNAGDVAVYYIKEPRGDVGRGSSVKCWVDDNYGGAVLLENAGDVGGPTPELAVIDHYVAAGSHFVECVLDGEEGKAVPSFKIIGVFGN